MSAAPISRIDLTTPPAGSAPPALDDFDALADLFLGDVTVPVPPVAAATGASVPQRPTPTIELLIQGHLPVRAAPWFSQYARLRAHSGQIPVALLRLASGHLSIDTFGSHAPDRACTTFAGARSALRASVRAGALIIVQADEAHLAALAGDPRVGTITILTGANDAAVVATYRTMKDVASAIAARAPAPDLRVALVGADEVTAQRAMHRLRHASAVFLDRPLNFGGVIDKLGATGSALFFRGPCDLAPAQVLEALAEPEREEPEVHPTMKERNGRGTTPVSVSSSAAGAVAEPAAPSLVSIISGLRPLRARCPDAPEVELAVDEAGAVHLLHAAEEPGDIAALLSASAWAKKHLGLLALASVAAPIDASRPVTPHLFTDVPKRLRHLLDADIRVHALVLCAGKWCEVELN